MNNFEKDKYITSVIHKKQLEMLFELNEILKINNIQYFLACGTCLGCIRHSGFIPWDDDVDIYIKGSDYKQFAEIFNSDKYVGNLELHDYNSKNDYPYPFPKIVLKNTYLCEKMIDVFDYKCGLYIDIFLLSDISNIKFVSIVQEKKRYFYYCLLRAYYHHYDGFLCLVNKLARMTLNINQIKKKYFKCCTRSCKTSIKTVDIGEFGRKAILKKDFFQKAKYKKFCNLLLPIPFSYHEYLSSYYGNYLKLPSNEDRKSNHDFKRLIIDGEIII